MPRPDMFFRRTKKTPDAPSAQPAEDAPVYGNMRAAVEHHEAATHPDGRFLVDYHNRMLAEQGGIRRTDLPCRALSPIMPNLFMMAPVTPAAEDWEIRIVGQEIITRLGIDATGHRISEFLTPDQTAHHATIYRDVAAGRRLSITTGRIEGLDRDYVTVEFVHVPLLGPDGQSKWMMGGVFFGDLIRTLI
ncbi:PAS domain-containing protein [Pyruvatibacter mobilis]|uniref:PAS domain-containing protein n=1 Tax=Pyruvatibacter mobilis TaxID=1712261 RepID=UPI003BAD1088